MTYDLILKGARVIDPSQSIDRIADVAFSDGKVALVADDIPSRDSKDVRDVRGRIVTPGLIDLHTHVYWGGTALGIDAEAYCRQNGVTTSVDTGSSGPGNFAGFRKHVIEPSPVRILAYLHVSFAGMFAFSRGVMVGESEDIRLMAPVEALDVVERNRDIIVGVKVRIGLYSSGRNGTHPLDIALQVAADSGLPVMAHIDYPPPSYEEVLERLRPGDILTHAFRPFPNSPVAAQGRIKPIVQEARKRGVLFDIGHGMKSFSFKTARAMLAGGFPPDTISSDIHQLCIDGPAFDQTTTLSKFMALGMRLSDVIAASTVNSAMALRRPELGTLKPGAVGDATILAIEEGSFDFVDGTGEVVRAEQRLVSKGVVISGRWWHPEAA